VRARVNAAREIQNRRFAGTGVGCNAYMGSRELAQFCRLDEKGDAMLRAAYDRLGLTARSHDKILRVARTIADLAGSETIDARHLAEALQFRG
jgi:magnesium chelatase family protein